MQYIVRKYRNAAAAAWLMAFMLLLSLPMTAQAQDMMEAENAFASVRRYEDLDPADMDELNQHVIEGFLPLIRETPGYLGYYLLPADDGVLVAVSLFETQEQASSSNELARDFVAENLAPLLPSPPQIIEGRVELEFVELLADMDMDMDMDMAAESADEAQTDDVMADEEGISALFASVRIYDDYNLEHLDETNARAREIFLPQLREAPGFFGYYTMTDGVDMVVAMNIFESEAASLASNDMARDFVAEHLAEFDLGSPAVTSGYVSVASLMALHAGENLVGMDMNDQMDSDMDMDAEEEHEDED